MRYNMSTTLDNCTEEDLRAELERSKQPPPEYLGTTISVINSAQWIEVRYDEHTQRGNFYLVIELPDDYLGNLPDLLGDLVLSIMSDGVYSTIGTITDQILLSKLTSRAVVEDWCDTLNSKVMKVPIYWSDILEDKVCPGIYLLFSLYSVDLYNGRIALQYDSYALTKTYQTFNHPRVEIHENLDWIPRGTICIFLTKVEKRPCICTIGDQEINIIDMDNGCYIIPVTPSIYDVESCAHYLCSRLDPERPYRHQIKIFDEDTNQIDRVRALVITYTKQAASFSST